MEESNFIQINMYNSERSELIYDVIVIFLNNREATNKMNTMMWNE